MTYRYNQSKIGQIIGNTIVTTTSTITSPMQLMRRFEKLTKIKNTKAYLNMQKAYMTGTLKKGLYCTSNSVLMSDKRIYNAEARLLENIERVGTINSKISLRETLQSSNLIMGARLFGTWRNTATVFSLDKDIAEQSIEKGIPDDTPSEMFANLPEWCVYMEIPDNSNIHRPYMTIKTDDETNPEERRKAIGFWALKDEVNSKSRDGEYYLDLVFNFEHTSDVLLEDMQLVPIRILISPNQTVSESLEEMYSTIGHYWQRGLGVVQLKSILSMLLWVCVEEPDVTNMKDVKLTRDEIMKPRFVKSRESALFVAPFQERYLQIAKRLGGELREYRKEIEHAKHTSLPKRKIPHIRRGHWGSVWVGTGEERYNKVYWQDTIFVNGN